MSKLVRIDEDCEVLLRKYSSGSISDCIRAMNILVEGRGNFEATLRKVVQEEGVNLHPTTKQAFQNLNRTLVEVMSAHNKM